MESYGHEINVVIVEDQNCHLLSARTDADIKEHPVNCQMSRH